MILIKLSALGTDGSRVMLWFDDGSKMRVPTSLVADWGLYRGMELGEDDLSRLMEETQRASARNRAVRIVSSTSISEKSLKAATDSAGRKSRKCPGGSGLAPGLGRVG